MNRSAFSSVSALILVLTTSVVLAQSGTLQPGDLELDSGEYMDLYDLQVERPGTYRFAIDSADFDPFLVVLDAAGEVVAAADDSAGHGLQVDEAVELGAPGLYTVVVTSAFPRETGTYNLVMEAVDAEPAAEGTAAAPGFDLPDLAAPTPTTPAAGGDGAPRPQSRSQPRPGFITGTLFGTDGEPLAGASVLITGTTYEQGQRTQFEATSGADGTFAVRVPDGRYEAKAWVDVEFAGRHFSRLLHPLSGKPGTEVDSTTGGNLDFQWRLSGLSAWASPPGTDPSHFYGAAIELSYCGLPADAYCTPGGNGVPATPIAPGGSLVTVTLTPDGPLVDGSAGKPLSWQFTLQEQDPDYPYGDGVIPGYPNGGGGRLKLGSDWEYRSADLMDIPLGSYRMTATITLPGGGTQPLRLGLADDDVEYGSVPVTFEPWEDYSARSYTGGGITQLEVYVRD